MTSITRDPSLSPLADQSFSLYQKTHQGTPHQHPYQDPAPLARPSPSFFRDYTHPSISAPSLLLTEDTQTRTGNSLGRSDMSYSRTADIRPGKERSRMGTYLGDGTYRSERDGEGGEWVAADGANAQGAKDGIGPRTPRHRVWTDGQEKLIASPTSPRHPTWSRDQQQYARDTAKSGATNRNPAPILSPPRSSTLTSQHPFPPPLTRAHSAKAPSLSPPLPSPTSRDRLRNQSHSPLLTPPQSSISPSRSNLNSVELLTSFLSVGEGGGGGASSSAGTGVDRSSHGGREGGRTISNASTGSSFQNHRVSFTPSPHTLYYQSGETTPHLATQKKLNARLQPLWDFLTSEEIRREGAVSNSALNTAGQGMGKDKGVEGVKEWVRMNVSLGSRYRDLSRELEILREELPEANVYKEIFSSHEVRLALPLNVHRYPPLMNDYGFFTISKNAVVDCLVEANETYAVGGTPKEERERVEAMHFLERMTGVQTVSDGPSSRENVFDRSTSSASGEGRDKRRMALLPNPTMELSPPILSRSMTTLDGRTADKPKEYRRPSTIREHPSPANGRGTITPDAATPLSLTSSRSSLFSPGPGSQSATSIKAEKLLGLVRTKTKDGSISYNDAPSAQSSTPGLERKTVFWRRGGPAGNKGKEKGLGFKGLASAIFGSTTGTETGNDGLANLREAVGIQDRRWESRSAPVSRQTKSTGAIPNNLLGQSRKGKHPEVFQAQSVIRDNIIISSELANAQLTTSGHAKSSSRALERRIGGLHEEQVLEVLMTYVAKRMRSSEADDQRPTKSATPESASPVAFVKAQQTGNKPASSSGGANLEAVITKLNHIKFELITHCQGNILPAIEAALDRVRFGLGFVIPGQLIKRLEALSVRPPRRNHPGDPSIAEQQHWIRNTMMSWIRLRETAGVSRWDISRVIKQELLGKLNPELQDLVLASMSLTRLPVTPFPPRSSADTTTKQARPTPGTFKLGNLVNNSAVSLSLGMRRPSLPCNLGTAGASTTSVNSTHSSNSWTSSTSPGAAIDNIVADILALPTAGNSREVLMTWIGRERRRRLRLREGWWIVKAGSIDGPGAVSEAMCRIEMDCLAKGQKGLIPIFRQVRLDMLLPPSPILPSTVASAGEALRLRSDPTLMETRPASSAAMRLEDDTQEKPSWSSLPVPPRPASAMTRHDSQTTATPTAQHPDVASSRQQPDVTTSFSSSSMPPLAGLGISVAPAIHTSGVASGSSTAGPSILARASNAPEFGLDDDSIAQSRSGNRDQYRMSESSLGTTLDMASILGTRDAMSRASNHSRDPSYRGLEEELGVEIMTPLTELTEDISETAATPRGQESFPLALFPPLPGKNRFSGLFGSTPEVQSPFQADHRSDAGEICPFPAPLPGTRPPAAIPSRGSSLADRAREVPLDSPLDARTRILPQLRLNTDLSAPPVSTLHKKEIPLALILPLFTPSGKIKPDVTPAQLRIVLLKVIDLEQRFCAEEGKRWMSEDVARVAWLINQVRMMIGLKQLDRLFNGVIATMEDPLNSSSHGSMQSIAQMSTTPSFNPAAIEHQYGGYSFPASPSNRRNTFGPTSTPIIRSAPGSDGDGDDSVTAPSRSRLDSKPDRSEYPTHRSGYTSPPIPTAPGQLRLVGSPVAALSTIEGSLPDLELNVDGEEGEEADDRAGRPAMTGHTSGRDRNETGGSVDRRTRQDTSYATSRAASGSSGSHYSFDNSARPDGPMRSVSRDGSGSLEVHPATTTGTTTATTSRRVSAIGMDLRADSHQAIQSEDAQATRSPLEGRRSFDAYSLKEAPPPPYDPLACLLDARGGEGEGSGTSAGGA